jgi:aspartate kinase
MGSSAAQSGSLTAAPLSTSQHATDIAQPLRATVVQKFGGTSVADAAKLRQSATHALSARAAGRRVVMVVSAMGHTTDELLDLAGTLDGVHGQMLAEDASARAADKRELDQLLATGEQVACSMMAMTLRRMGQPAMSLTGAQAGIRTDHVHGRASIKLVAADRLEAMLDTGTVPVVCGFQGVTDEGDVTTLGRGGSDTTAVALAARLEAECEIYKDVDGVFTADPRIVPEARLRPVVLYEEMLEAASLGSQVIHPRAVELARKFNVPVRVLHSQHDGGQDKAGRATRGTVVLSEERFMEARVVSSVVLKPGVGRVSLRGLVNVAGVQARVFGPIAAAHIPVDDIIQEDDGPGTINLTFTLDKNDLPEVQGLLQSVAREVGAQSLRADGGLCTVSAVGAGMRTSSGVAAMMFKALADEKIVVENITTSEIRISAVVREGDGPRAVRCVHRAFGLHSPEAEAQATALLSGRLAERTTEIKPTASMGMPAGEEA